MWTLLVLCSAIALDGVQGAHCGGQFYGRRGVFNSPNYPNHYPPNSDCIWYITPSSGIVQLAFPILNIEFHQTCAYDAIYVYDGYSTSSRLLGKVCGTKSTTFNSTGTSLTVRFKSDGIVSLSGFRAEYQVVASCRYNCGYEFENCSCSSSCGYRGNCCPDYEDSCSATSAPASTAAQPSCRYNCGRHLGSCSCSSSCRYQGNCCHDYNYFCPTSTQRPPVTARPSCYSNCGGHMGSCSCSSSCQYYGTCCYDYHCKCQVTQINSVNNISLMLKSVKSLSGHTDMLPASQQLAHLIDKPQRCLGTHVETSVAASWEAAPAQALADTKETAVMTTTDRLAKYLPCLPAQPSCRYNCGRHLGSCSCSSSCRYQGNCCHDYNYFCPTSTQRPPVTARPSCYSNCGGHMGSCSCSSSCQYYGTCCYDYHCKCQVTQINSVNNISFMLKSVKSLRVSRYSCRNKCGSFLGSCSCTSSCRYQGNCCYDYNSYCQTTSPPTTAYCQATTDMPATVSPCGGSLSGSGTFSSPNHPNHYYDNAYCVWQLRAAYDQRIFLSFTYLQLENCCSCDYIAVYDGPSVSSRYLGKVCNNNNNNNSLSTFYSTSNYLTVLFRTDSSVVGRGFNADFISSLPPSSGRVDCSSDNMNIVIQRTYLNSLGYDGQSLYLNDPHCRPQVSRFQVVFNFPINTCGNVRKFENGRVVYTNTLRAYTSSSGEITRQSHLKMSVGCRMDQDSVAQMMYIVRHHDNSSITGTGRFNTSMDFYTSSSFYYKVFSVPYEVTLNQNLYVQVDLRRGDSSLVLYLDTCVTSPSPHDFQTRSYYLVRNGCPVDNSYQAYITGSRAYGRFTFKAFQFLRATESVYIQCKVLICQASDYNSRCRRGCNKRAARDLGSEHDSQTLVLGPIKLKDPEKKEEETLKQNQA
ncbi:uncharacterized protein LOC142931665 [Anarhichas minor]|uniref:uncharacterized protein LOC142931665 n=1 Tax=Anarhichas minor TaxID=65739 RepID=UPI003F73C85A